MKNIKLILYGVGKFAEYVHYVLKNDSAYDIIAFTVENAFFSDELQMPENLPLINFDKIQEVYPPNQFEMMIAVGNNTIREKIFNRAKNEGYSFGSYISSKAVTWGNIEIGENTFISEDCGIQPFVSIGNNTILIGPRIGHHSTIGNNVLMSCSYLAGNVSIGDNCFLGLNSSIKEKVRIGKNNIIGMNAVITSSTKDNEIFTAPKAVKRINARAKSV